MQTELLRKYILYNLRIMENIQRGFQRGIMI
jgi:hypothetical protein